MLYISFSEKMSKKRSPIMQQELLRRRSGGLTRSVSGYPVSPSPPLPASDSSLRRRATISPAANDFVLQSRTSYGTKLRRRKALLVGIGYQSNKNLAYLRGCKNDVKEIFSLLQGELFGFQEHEIRVLCDELQHLGKVQVGFPTRANILRDMKWLTQDIVAGDSVIFFFAGHGERVQDTSGDEVDTGFDQCIMPVDYVHVREPIQKAGKIRIPGVEPILDDTIYERLVRSIPDGAKVTAIVDACKSGTICDLPVIYDEYGMAQYRNGECRPPRDALRPHRAAGGCVLFSGSADHQLSADMTAMADSSGRTVSQTESYGIMTRSFVSAIRQMCAIRSREYDGVEPWTYGQLLMRLRELVEENSERAHSHLQFYIEKQEPQLSTSHAFDIWKTNVAI